MMINKKPKGFSIIEVIVVLGILMTITSLILPAIQASRESSRRLSCTNNLKQIGVAINLYYDSNSVFPCNILYPNAKEDTNYSFYSFCSRILVDLDQPLFNSINFQTGTLPLDCFGVPNYNPMSKATFKSNVTSYNTPVKIFMCPSDSLSGYLNPITSYRGNAGTGPGLSASFEYPDSGNGIFGEIGVINASHVTDGLSNTAFVSERTVGSGIANNSSFEYQNVNLLTTLAFSTSDILKGCRISEISSPRSIYTNSGKWWFWAGREKTLYTHAQIPNGSVIDCMVSGAIPPTGMSTARSYHNNGVNLLLGDGSVRFIKSTINPATWFGLGTRGGGEALDSGEF
jgi:prepilin-type processing-associated H-X9-DG protein